MPLDAPPEARAPDEADGGETPVEPTSARHRRRRSVIEWLAVVGAAVVLSLVVRSYLLEVFWIPSASMEATLSTGDRVVVDRLSYRLHGVHRGDVVVLARPPLLDDPTVKDLVKRVVALPGERVAVHDGHVFIDGRQLVEPYTRGLPTDLHVCAPDYGHGLDRASGLLVPPGEVLLLGDNRTNSQDGRCFGPVSTKLIVGRATFRIWPPGRLGRL